MKSRLPYDFAGLVNVLPKLRTLKKSAQLIGLCLCVRTSEAYRHLLFMASEAFMLTQSNPIHL